MIKINTNVSHTLKYGAILLILLMSGVLFVPGAAAQEGETARLTVVAPALNVRSGPGLNHPAFDLLLQGETRPVLAQDAASGWWQIELPSGASGWVSNGPEYVSLSDELGQETTPAPAIQAAPAPANGTLVFQTGPGGAIYAIEPDGTNLRYLTTGLDPVISPDGQQVAFTRWETSQDGALGNVWLINIDGGNERVIHEYVFNPRTPVWSPDGSKLVIGMQHGGQIGELDKCSSRRPPRKAYNISIERDADGGRLICFTLPPDPHWGLRMIDLASGQHEDLPDDVYSFSPAWDPLYSGHLIYDGDFGLVNLDLYENRTWALTEDFNDHSPVYSPDGSKIAVSYRQDDHWEVHTLNADGSGRQRLTQTSYQTLVEQQLRGETPRSYHNAAPVWSPDGSQIAFLTDRTGPWEIWVMNTDGSNQRPLVSAEMLGEIELHYNGKDEQALSWR